MASYIGRLETSGNARKGVTHPRLGRRLEIRRVRFQAQRLDLVRIAERKYSDADTGRLENNAGISGEECFMYNNNSSRSRAASARGFMALFAILLAMGLGLMARPAEAAPFAYVANSNDNTVSVIDTASNKAVGTRSRWGIAPLGSPSPRTGNTSLSRMMPIQALFR